jgi:hypothetical protein
LVYQHGKTIFRKTEEQKDYECNLQSLGFVYTSLCLSPFLFPFLSCRVCVLPYLYFSSTPPPQTQPILSLRFHPDTVATLREGGSKVDADELRSKEISFTEKNFESIFLRTNVSHLKKHSNFNLKIHIYYTIHITYWYTFIENCTIQNN